MTKVEKGPGTSGRTRMLTTHKESNHHVSNLCISERATRTVFLLHKSRNHIMFMLQKYIFNNSDKKKVTHIVIAISPFLDDVNIKLAHLDMSPVSFPIALQR